MITRVASPSEHNLLFAIWVRSKNVNHTQTNKQGRVEKPQEVRLINREV